MGKASRIEAISRWICAAVGALAAHGALLLTDLDAPAVAIETETTLVWLEAAPEPVRHDAGSRAEAPAASHAEVTARQSARRKRSARALPSWTSPAPEPAAQPLAAGAPPDAEAAEPNAEPSASGVATGTAGALAAGMATSSGQGAAGVAGAQPPVSPPSLVAFGDPCRGFYPAVANADHGEVRVVVRVDRDGSTHDSEIVAEMPSRQGFASAARACVARLRFRPARDALGGAVPGRAVLALSFDRS